MGGGEAELLRAARRGDDNAFGQLIRPCLDPAFRMAVRILDNATDAEDAVQEALYKAWSGLAKFRGDAKFSTWLYRIVWRECVDRTRGRRSVPLDAELVDTDVRSDPVTQWETAETRSEVEQALARLSVPYRTVLTLFYIEDLPKEWGRVRLSCESAY